MQLQQLKLQTVQVCSEPFETTIKVPTLEGKTFGVCKLPYLVLFRADLGLSGVNIYFIFVCVNKLQRDQMSCVNPSLNTSRLPYLPVSFEKERWFPKTVVNVVFHSGVNSVFVEDRSSAIATWVSAWCSQRKQNRFWGPNMALVVTLESRGDLQSLLWVSTAPRVQERDCVKHCRYWLNACWKLWVSSHMLFLGMWITLEKGYAISRQVTEGLFIPSIRLEPIG